MGSASAGVQLHIRTMSRHQIHQRRRPFQAPMPQGVLPRPMGADSSCCRCTEEGAVGRQRPWATIVGDG